MKELQRLSEGLQRDLSPGDSVWYFAEFREPRTLDGGEVGFLVVHGYGVVKVLWRVVS